MSNWHMSKDVFLSNKTVNCYWHGIMAFWPAAHYGNIDFVFVVKYANGTGIDDKDDVCMCMYECK